MLFTETNTAQIRKSGNYDWDLECPDGRYKNSSNPPLNVRILCLYQIDRYLYLYLYVYKEIYRCIVIILYTSYEF